MKRRIFATVVIVTIAALSFFGNQLAGRALDAKLAPLLAKQLGLPVQVGPITAHLLQLRAQSSTLVMGDAKDPAVAATNVEVSLVLSALLRGEIRLRHASADDLIVRPSRWPSSDNPAPKDYVFLDQWLPGDLQAQTGHYVSADGDDYAVNDLHWQRKMVKGASVQWWEQREAGKVTLDVELKSLKDLLLLAPVQLDMTMQVEENPNSLVSLTANIQPSESAAYSLKAEVRMADMAAQINTIGQEAWGLPERSDITIPLLKLGPLFTLFDAYSDSSATETNAATLALKLPRLSLPAHQSNVTIKEIRLQGEISMDTSFTLISSAQGVQVNSLSSIGPTGILTGELAVKSGRQGWTVTADVGMQERATNAGFGSQYIGTEWLWSTGHAKLGGSGDTGQALLNALRGDISLAGHYKNKESTPVSIEARLDNSPGKLALDHIAVVLGKGQIIGSASLSDNGPHKLVMNLKGKNLALDFLATDDEGQALLGIAIPKYLNSFPNVDLDMTLLVEGFKAPEVTITQAQATLERNAEGGKLVVKGIGKHAGTFELALETDGKTDQLADLRLSATFDKLDFSAMFRQDGEIFSRTSGNMHFAGRGEGVNDIFKAMSGSSKLTVEVRADNDWKRPSKKTEELLFSGDSYLVTDKDRIVGIRLKKIDIDSFDQDLTGSISIVAGRNPWLTAKLASEKLNISELRSLLPSSTDGTDETDLLSGLRKLGAVTLSLKVKSLTFDDVDLSDVQLEAVSNTRIFDIETLNFTTRHGVGKGQGKISWEGEQAALNASADISDIDLDQFLIQGMEDPHVPVSGSAKLSSQGSTISELLSRMTGYVNLQATQPQQGKSLHTRRKLEMKATQLSDGLKAEITTLQWGESDLSASIVYRRTTPRLLKINLRSSALSLLPWENAELAKKAEAKTTKTPEPSPSGINATAEFVGGILLSPLRFLSDTSDDDATSSEKLFSSEPLPIDAIKNLNILMDVELNSLKSNVISAKALSFKGNLTDGKWLVKTSLSQLSGGSLEATVNLNVNAVPAELNFTTTFKTMRGLADQNTYPRSGYISIKTQGGSEAELAASTDGLLYAEVGKGPFDYSSSALFTTNLISSVFTTLIPGIDREKPQVQCGVVLALFKDGKGITPYGFALRTNDANLLGHIQVDLGEETIDMSLDSQGRQGAGISVGSIFSNTVDLKGPLSDPAIVPNTASILVRGWAAVMTAGLSVLGESMVKRILASENPCPEINKQISKDLCPKNALAASSEMVCPKA
ncbi:MAG: hypothetical protein ACJ04P_02780 [Halioglobus sp.]